MRKCSGLQCSQKSKVSLQASLSEKKKAGLDRESRRAARISGQVRWRPGPEGRDRSRQVGHFSKTHRGVSETLCRILHCLRSNCRFNKVFRTLLGEFSRNDRPVFTCLDPQGPKARPLPRMARRGRRRPPAGRPRRLASLASWRRRRQGCR